MDVLNDKQLEASELIKELDTLKIIRAVNEIKLKQKRKRLKLLMSIMVIFCILAQILLFKWIGFNQKVMMLSGVYILGASLILLIMRFKEGERV